ncbi:hypothetical protein MJO47_11490 [Desulfuromonas sp. KJ2020]|uniref:hypothetical protein n=1 Tax=Desulfuromonas sp. KJ2020 TaxID=2919173 RepID=UPI0020A750D9|nr:hypothetical protein [Desulfuromonas sp. KJ2020]MCP3177727.1 hypothetical protein [Desulfuromonas sp. KJ2020]
MRVMMTGPGQSPLSKVILAFFYVYFVLHWVTGILMFHHKLGSSYQSVVRYFLGDPEQFMNPRSFIGLLEVTHFHLFAMGLFFVVFSHLLLFCPFGAPVKAILTWLLGLSLLLDILSPWLIRYVAAPFAWLKLASFWTLQGVSLILLLGLLAALFRRRPPVNS